MVLFAVRVHQDAIDVARVKLASMVVMMATMVAMSIVIHVGVQQRVAAVSRFGRLVDRVCDKAQARCAHQDDLKHPVADVRDRKGFVIASLVAAGLHGVANEHNLFILVDLFSHYSHYENTEDHHHRQQDPAKDKQQERRGGREGKWRNNVY